MQSPKRILCLCLLLLLASPVPAARALAAETDTVTPTNLLASERWWPYHVKLTRPWTPVASTQPIGAGARGVLIRVEASGLARIDFGRKGLHDVPVAETDLLETANRIRRGELAKQSPNFVTAIAPRLIDPVTTPPRVLATEVTARQRGFLCVFANPDAKEFPAIAAALAPLRERADVLTIFFPHAARSDARIAEQLRELAWPVPFVLDHLAEPYAHTLLPAKTAPPAVLLQTNEGRLLYESTWKPERMSELNAALEAGFSGPSR